MNLFLQIINEDRPEQKLIIEAEDGPCFAYATESGKIKGHIWLSNGGAIESSMEQGNPPALPQEFIHDEHKFVAEDISEFSAAWVCPENLNGLVAMLLFQNKKIIGVWVDGQYSGFSKFAKNASNVVRPLSDVPFNLEVYV